MPRTKTQNGRDLKDNSRKNRASHAAWIARKRARNAQKNDQYAHRRNSPFCAKCGGTCEYDDDGNRVTETRTVAHVG